MKYKINLLKDNKKKYSLIDRVIYFSLNYFRYILVITQLVVIFVFFYKFKVDQEIVDLKDSIDQKKEIVVVSKNLLTDGQFIEKKINYLKPIIYNQKKTLNEIKYLLSIFPQPVYLSELTIEKDKIILKCFTSDSSIIKLFYQRLLNDKKFKNISLSDLKKNDFNYTFIITLENYEV